MNRRFVILVLASLFVLFLVPVKGSASPCPAIPEVGDNTFPSNVAVPSVTSAGSQSNSPCARIRHFDVTIQNLRLNGTSNYQFFMRCTDTFDAFFFAADDTHT